MYQILREAHRLDTDAQRAWSYDPDRYVCEPCWYQHGYWYHCYCDEADRDSVNIEPVDYI